MKKITLIFGLVLLLTACPMDYEHGFNVKNNSNQTILVTGGYILPDTLLPEKPNKLITVNVGKRYYVYGSLVGDDDLDQLYYANKILTLFILSKNSVDSYSWEYIRENNIILKRYEFDSQELEMMNRTITYP